jgi:hypothetical protein
MHEQRSFKALVSDVTYIISCFTCSNLQQAHYKSYKDLYSHCHWPFISRIIQLLHVLNIHNICINFNLYRILEVSSNYARTNCRYINRNFEMLIKTHRVMLCLCGTYELCIIYP